MISCLVTNFKFLVFIMTFAISVDYPDVREGICYPSSVGGQCLSRTDAPLRMTKSECCCSSGAAWGPNCEKCPSQGTGQ